MSTSDANASAPSLRPPSPRDSLDRFLTHYFARRPVNATFTGVHEHDDRLPDWSPDGLAATDDEMRRLRADLEAEHPAPASAQGYLDDPDLLDAELARGFLEIQLAENAGRHGVRGNPALWTGEAIFSVVSLMIRDFAPFGQRVESAAARLEAIPAFLGDAVATLEGRETPAAWTARALRECEGGAVLLERGIPRWLASHEHDPALGARVREAARRAATSLQTFELCLRDRREAPERALACGVDHFDLLLRRGHFTDRSRADLLFEVRERFGEERRRLDEMAGIIAGSWPEARDHLAAHRPGPEEYLHAFGAMWHAAHALAASSGVVTWPDWPIRYVEIPEWTREAAPYLYYLYYRSPAPFDPYDTHDYVVPTRPSAESRVPSVDYATIKLNHVVHHGGIGHHVQNWHAYHRARTRIGRIAAVDTASRIGMFCGGTMAEGWACYATGLMEELGFLTPLERVSEQHSRVRFLARAIVDIELHQGTMSHDDAVRFHADASGAGLGPDAARAEVAKCSMFPGTALMYWLGTQGILDLRETVRDRQGATFSPRRFHDELLGHGSIPVPLAARLMTERAS